MSNHSATNPLMDALEQTIRLAQSYGEDEFFVTGPLALEPLPLPPGKIVFGVGAIKPKVLFVSQASGADNAGQGEPFSGPAGALLDKILSSIGLSRQTVYLMHFLKPSGFEILNQQIEILDPPVICALGPEAAGALLKSQADFTALRGKTFQFSIRNRKISLIPTYHPSALLADESLKKDVWQDMKLLRSLVQQVP